MDDLQTAVITNSTLLDKSSAPCTAGSGITGCTYPEWAAVPDAVSRKVRDLGEKIRGYLRDVPKNDRSRSWEHCYGYFHKTTPEAIAKDRDLAALRLGFYLASWGMYRPVSGAFLWKYDYTVHLGVVDRLVTGFSDLWGREFGGGDDDELLVPRVVAACQAVQEAYRPFGQATPLLVTKVILGTFGCLPAFDDYFKKGDKYGWLRNYRVDNKVIKQVLRFSQDNLDDLRAEQREIESACCTRYPLMKLVDMYFHQAGWELEKQTILNAGAGKRRQRCGGATAED